MSLSIQRETRDFSQKIPHHRKEARRGTHRPSPAFHTRLPITFRGLNQNVRGNGWTTAPDFQLHFDTHKSIWILIFLGLEK